MHTTMPDAHIKPSLRDCPFCGSAPEWCDCGAQDCHYIECKTCGVQFNWTGPEAQQAPDFPELYAACAKAWNTREGEK